MRDPYDLDRCDAAGIVTAILIVLLLAIAVLGSVAMLEWAL